MSEISFRQMEEADLDVVGGWLRSDHVARWWTPDTTAKEELELYRERVSAPEPATRMLIVVEGGEAIGFCQWYRWDDYPEDAAAVGARPGELGVDYAIGAPDRVGRGVGTRMIGALVDHVRRLVPGAGIVVDPDARNLASRRVLEKNGFGLVEVRPVATEPTDQPMAIYRLIPVAGSAPSGGSGAGAVAPAPAPAHRRSGGS